MTSLPSIPDRGLESLISDFTVGFWHPFGPHGGETAMEILERKQQEIDAVGWTLWSFQFRRTQQAWYQEIMRTKPRKVLVFCSEGKGAKDPVGEIQPCRRYRTVDNEADAAIPNAIQIPHPMGKSDRACAFVMEEIVIPRANIELFPAEWYRTGGTWEETRIPTRGEFLIRRGGQINVRRYRAILVLRYPYLATIRP